MARRNEKRPRLTVIPGGRSRQVRCGGLNIMAGPAKRALFSVEGIVFEEDTFLVMSGDSDGSFRDEHPIRIMTDALEAMPVAPGSVLLKGRDPLRILAVIHDFDRHPSCREAWVRAAMRNMLVLADEKSLKAIAMPLLGTEHGSIDADRSLQALADSLKEVSPTRLQRIWLYASETRRMDILDRLEKLFG